MCNRFAVLRRQGRNAQARSASDRIPSLALRACVSNFVAGVIKRPALAPIHQAQLLSYLKATGLRLGFLINFKGLVLKDGIKRLVR